MESDLKSLFLCSFSLLFLMLVNADDPTDVCTQINSCSCQNSKGVIDLSPLALSGGDPKFKDQQDSSGNYYYSWNPCNPFTEDPTSCSGVMGCQTDMTNYFSLGTPDSAKFTTDTSKGLILQYSATTDATRTLDVILKCDESKEASLAVAGENPPGSATYEMTLTSKYACPSAGGGPTITVGLSTGSYITIIFFAVFVVYFIAGVLFQKFARHASGKEITPNLSFWSALPGLIKDGVLFTVKCGKGKSSYDNI
ncbi:hypothetical protein LOTGIDRAFT_168623 [Lottia gigantea]|uniref:Autophagy-related protein 27 n=1 Tax=Lottia gigantea TaxID=225164 RepID=V4B7H7_LOTGI|nr:hypothetical protein LOTGIDRAFT_168623 [Lottia gigantea]ESO84554.1 hypothetical protein LOTGIDRAFT_168623 [Lottia gigantea]